MFNITKSKLITFISVVFFHNYTLANAPTNATAPSAKIEGHSSTVLQDSAKAQQFFQDQLDFTTNPSGVKAVVEGRVTNVTIIDVRSEEDYAKSHIKGAINIPFNKHSAFKGDEKEFPELRKDGFNYVYCYDAFCNLGMMACKKFSSLGYPVKEVKGGFEEWKNHKYPVEPSQAQTK